jgi:hypothetical protein
MFASRSAPVKFLVLRVTLGTVKTPSIIYTTWMPNTLSTSCSKKSDTMCTGVLHSAQAHVFSDYLYFYTRNKTSFFSFHKNWRKNERKTKEKQEKNNI